MKLLFYGHEFLMRPSYFPVVPDGADGSKFLKLVERRMLAVVRQYRLKGLTAPQIGIPYQVMMMRRQGGEMLTIVNPEIVRMYGAETEYPEGCISCPPGNNCCRVARMQVIHVVGGRIERPGVQEEWKFKGEESRIAQHEVDHLEGTFFLDRANLVEKDKVIERFHQWQHTFRTSGKCFPN